MITLLFGFHVKQPVTKATGLTTHLNKFLCLKWTFKIRVNRCNAKQYMIKVKSKHEGNSGNAHHGDNGGSSPRKCTDEQVECQVQLEEETKKDAQEKHQTLDIHLFLML